MLGRRMVWFASALLVVPVAQEPTKPAGREPSAPAASVPTEAIAYGDALFRNATPELRSWVQAFAKKNVRRKPLDPRGTMQQVDAQKGGGAKGLLAPLRVSPTTSSS